MVFSDLSGKKGEKADALRPVRGQICQSWWEEIKAWTIWVQWDKEEWYVRGMENHSCHHYTTAATTQTTKNMVLVLQESCMDLIAIKNDSSFRVSVTRKIIFYSFGNFQVYINFYIHSFSLFPFFFYFPPGLQLKCFIEWPKLKQLPWNLIGIEINETTTTAYFHLAPTSQRTFILEMWVCKMYGCGAGLVGSGWFILFHKCWHLCEQQSLPLSEQWLALEQSKWGLGGI